jgi:2-keto-4-pentenoate hydratase/2-oxohepta-3-ene-1,7-dioic acid hydratase in catechol pathway
MSTKWCRFEKGGKVSCGRIDGDTVIAVDGAPWEQHGETGTNGSPRNMKPGDVCEIEITGIGTLRNRVVAEE